MTIDFSNEVNLEDFAQIPVWAKAQARDPKVTRALVSTASERSELLRSVLKPRNLVHCYAKPGFGLEPWLTRFLSSISDSHFTFDITKLLQSNRFDSTQELAEWIGSKKSKPAVILLRLGRVHKETALSLIQFLAPYGDSHTLLLSSSTSPETWLSETRYFYTQIHLGEKLLGYSLDDYEKLTTRWPARPSKEMIQDVVSYFDGWPEPCLRSLCDLCDGQSETSSWLSGHQWVATYIFSLPVDLLQILLTAQSQPIITPEGLDLCDPDFTKIPAHLKSINIHYYDPKRRRRSQLLSTLCDHLLLEQFTHPRLHFRWSSKSLQSILSGIAKDWRQIQSLGLKRPNQLNKVTIELCALYLEHDYIEEIIQLCQQSDDRAGLSYLMTQQPGRVVDFLRGSSKNNQLKNTMTGQHFLYSHDNPVYQLTQYFQEKLYWSFTSESKSESHSFSNNADKDLLKAAEPMYQLLNQYKTSRSALANGQIADGLSRLENVFLTAVDERCFSLASPSIALIGITDFFCMNKKHLRKLLQSLDHAEALLDPETHISLIDWTYLAVTPLQMLSSHGQALAKRLDTKSHNDHAGRIPEEAFLFEEWVHALALIYSGKTKEAEQKLSNALIRITSHFRQLQDRQKHSYDRHKRSQQTQQSPDHSHTEHSYKSDLTPQQLLGPWTISILFIKLLNDLQTNGRPTTREAQNTLKQYEHYFVIMGQDNDRKDIWHMMRNIIVYFLKSVHSNTLDNIHQLEKYVNECQSLGFRLVWAYGSLLLSAALWSSEEEDRALNHFFTIIEFAENNGLQDILTPLTEILHPQIRRAKQKGKAVLLISRALDKIERKNHRKNNKLESLSKREMEILKFINHGMTNEDIAEHLCRAKGTVKLHVHNIYKKLEIKNRVEAIQLYNQYLVSEPG